MRQKFNFTPKLNLFKIFPRFQFPFQFYGQTITSNIVVQQITLFLPGNNRLDLTLNETKVRFKNLWTKFLNRCHYWTIRQIFLIQIAL